MTDMHEGATPKRPKLHPARMQKTPAHLNGAAELEKLCFSSPWSASSLELLTNDGIGVGYVLTIPAAPGAEPAVAAYGGMLITVDEGQITPLVHSLLALRFLERNSFSSTAPPTPQEVLPWV